MPPPRRSPLPFAADVRPTTTPPDDKKATTATTATMVKTMTSEAAEEVAKASTQCSRSVHPPAPSLPSSRRTRPSPRNPLFSVPPRQSTDESPKPFVRRCPVPPVMPGKQRQKHCGQLEKLSSWRRRPPRRMRGGGCHRRSRRVVGRDRDRN